jgi:hypothetical protein
MRLWIQTCQIQFLCRLFSFSFGTVIQLPQFKLTDSDVDSLIEKNICYVIPRVFFLYKLKLKPRPHFSFFFFFFFPSVYFVFSFFFFFFFFFVLVGAIFLHYMATLPAIDMVYVVQGIVSVIASTHAIFLLFRYFKSRGPWQEAFVVCVVFFFFFTPKIAR